MNIEIKVTLDDRETRINGRAKGEHRQSIGIEALGQTSISTNYYPEPGKLKILALAFPFKNKYCSHLVGTIRIDDEYLVSFNKKGFSKLGQELVDVDIIGTIKNFLETVKDEKQISELLEPSLYIKILGEWNEGSIEMTSANLRLVDFHSGKHYNKASIV